jgi:hypothetical protein
MLGELLGSLLVILLAVVLGFGLCAGTYFALVELGWITKGNWLYSSIALAWVWGLLWSLYWQTTRKKD